MKRPSFQFYPGDWLRDTALRSCSVSARGLWIDMICLMHDSTKYGYLRAADKVILTPNLARMVGATLPEVEGWLEELRQANVFSTDADGCMFSRRMIRDEEIRVTRAAGGIKGGNPALLSTSKKVNLIDNLDLTLGITPSSSSASSSSINKEELPFSSQHFATAWKEWIQHLTEKKKKPTQSAIRAQLKKCKRWGESRAIAALEHSTAGGYQGLFECINGSANNNHRPQASAI